MKTLTISLFCLTAFVCLVGRASSADSVVKASSPLDIYLCIGQSNMAGRAPFSGEDAEVVERCFLLNRDDLWEPAKNPLNRHSTIRKALSMQKMGPGYFFAKTLLANGHSKAVGLVVNAKGGTSIRQWKKGTTFYTEALRRTKIAMESGTLKGILWHQGETDQNDAQWLEKLKQLIGDLRTDLNAPTLPFVAGQVNDVELINTQVLRLPKEVANTAVVSSAGLKAMDRWHFDTPSMTLLGQRYAHKMQELLTKAK